MSGGCWEWKGFQKKVISELRTSWEEGESEHSGEKARKGETVHE
jgi:hypothetical protein